MIYANLQKSEKANVWKEDFRNVSNIYLQINAITYHGRDIPPLRRGLWVICR